ncbi:conjugative transposon protein TraJ [Dinghuibacter silviterrae]|nr:conjugative transposon protein TraJ [Dinghuibacter silviterrae]
MLALLLPGLSRAQGFSDGISGFNQVLQNLFDQMMPLCSRMIGVGRAIGGFGALWFIALRVWKHIARAEPVDFYPLLRPFAIGMAISFYPAVISLMNSVLQPTVTATAAMSGDSQAAIRWHIQQQENAIKQTPQPATAAPDASGDWDKYEQPDNTSDSKGFFNGLKSAFSFFNFKAMFQNFIRLIIQLLYEAAALCINTIRTFYLIVLALLGPLVFGLSIFDGFQQTLATWFARYIHVFMWLPVTNIFAAICSKILENMITMDQNFYSSVTYIIFMVISIVGYFTVPSVAGYIIHPGGGNDTLLHKVSSMSKQAATTAATALI